jgi:hypothetical protein
MSNFPLKKIDLVMVALHGSQNRLYLLYLLLMNVPD